MVVSPDVVAGHDDDTTVLVVGSCDDRGGDSGGIGVADGGASDSDTEDEAGFDRLRGGVGALGCCCCCVVAKTGGGEGPGVNGCVGVSEAWS